MRLLINGVIIANIAYLILFNFLPGGLRTAFAGLLGLSYIGIALLAAVGRLTASNVLMFLGMFLMFAPWVIGWVFDPWDTMRENSSLKKAFRDAVTYFAGIAILTYADKISPRVLFHSVWITLSVALVYVIVFPAFSLGGVIRFATFTGDLGVAAATEVVSVSLKDDSQSRDGLHASGYVIAMTSIIYFSLLTRLKVPLSLTIFLTLLMAILFLGYMVRTAIVIMAVLMISYLTVHFIKSGRKELLLFFAFAAGIVCLGILLLLLQLQNPGSIDINDFSSGRIGNYTERFGVLAERSFFQLLFGTGPGSDLLLTEQWIWDAKDSHSDILSLMFESGITGLLGLFLYLTGVFRIDRVRFIPFLAALVFSSAISNGLLGRPMTVTLFFVAMAILSVPSVTHLRRQA